MKYLLLIVGFASGCAAGAVENVDEGRDGVGNDHVAATAQPLAAAAACPAPTLLPVPGPDVTVLGDTGSTLGIFDPSTVYPAGAPGGAMAYSSVANQHSIRTRVALSNNLGASWTKVADLNTPEFAILFSNNPAECPIGFCLGWLISEVSSLIFDPSDPSPGARWKLYAHRYLSEANDRLHYALGTITVQTAPAPQGPWTAPRKLFGWPSSSSYSLDGAQVNIAQLPGLADCMALTEPSALWQPDRIDIAMGCVYPVGETFKIRVVLVRTRDHGATWTSVGTMLAPGAADCLPGTTPGASVNAPDLFIGPDGRQYLSVTSSDPAYHGCAVFRVDDPLTGHVERDASGAPRVLRTIAPQTGQFAGACSWTPSTGYQMSLGFFNTSRPFRITRASIPVP